MRLVLFCVAALALAGCGGTSGAPFRAPEPASKPQPSRADVFGAAPVWVVIYDANGNPVGGYVVP